MAKKIISEETEIAFFNSVLERIGVEKTYCLNDFIILKPSKLNYLLLLDLDSNLKKSINLKFDEIIDTDNLVKKINFLTEATVIAEWSQISKENEIYLSKIFPIKVDSFEYDIIINRDQMPFKLLKAEYDSVYFAVSKNLLLIKKRFESKLNDFGFSVIRGFQYI